LSGRDIGYETYSESRDTWKKFHQVHYAMTCLELRKSLRIVTIPDRSLLEISYQLKEAHGNFFKLRTIPSVILFVFSKGSE